MPTGRRRLLRTIIVMALLPVAGAAACREAPSTPPKDLTAARESMNRQNLFSELRPEKLANCTLARFGEPNDGGYLLCANLLGGAGAGYSYGISGYDGWGCDVSRALNVSVHQYDCFDLRQPSCATGRTIFHAECVAGAPFTEDGRAFDTVEHQLARNGDGARHVVMKMDVEGAEWDSLWATPDDVLQRIDQLDIEFHHTEEERFVEVVRRLKQFFTSPTCTSTISAARATSSRSQPGPTKCCSSARSLVSSTQRVRPARLFQTMPRTIRAARTARRRSRVFRLRVS